LIRIVLHAAVADVNEGRTYDGFGVYPTSRAEMNTGRCGLIVRLFYSITQSFCHV